MLEGALDNENKWQRDIGDRWRQDLIKDVVSVVVTVVIVYTVKPLPLSNHITQSRNKASWSNSFIRYIVFVTIKNWFYDVPVCKFYTYKRNRLSFQLLPWIVINRFLSIYLFEMVLPRFRWDDPFKEWF